MIVTEQHMTQRPHPHPEEPYRFSEKASAASRKQTAAKEETEKLCPVGWVLDDEKSECTRNTKGVVDAMIDFSADPCIQPYRHACGAFIDDPRNSGQNLLFFSLYQKNREVMQDIVLNHASEKAGDVGAFFHSCVDYLEKLSLGEDSRTFQEISKLVFSMETFDQLPHVMGMLARYDIPLPIALSFEVDPLKGSTLIPMLSQHLGVFVNSPNELGALEHLANLQKVTGCSLKSARQVSALQQTFLNIRDEVDSQTPFHVYASQTYNQTHLIRNWPQFLTAVNERGFSLSQMLHTAWPDAANKVQRAWVYSPHYMYRFAELHRTYPIDAWKVYLRYAIHVALERGVRTSPEYHYAYHRSYDGRWAFPWNRPHRFYMVASDSEESPEQQCVYATEAYIPILLDDYYLHAALDKPKIDAATVLADNIVETFQRILRNESSTLFSPHLPRAAAIEKLSHMQIILGAPAHWKELLQFQDKPIIGHSFIENVLQVRRYHKHYLEKMFAENPYVILEAGLLFDGLLHSDNAFYVHQLNTVIINAGILQEPLFSPYDAIEVQYGRLGVAIAHEISHSLDRVGTHFDRQGSIVEPPWMDREAFDRDTHYIISLYTRYSYLRNLNDGQKTLDENIADQYGLHIAWQALLSLNPEASFEQFRLAFAQTHCDALSRDTESRLAQRSAHSINSVRVNAGLATFPCQ